MKHTIVDRKYRFVSIFDDETGGYIRTGNIDKDGHDTGVDPFMASFPHLIDVGIMGHCANAHLCPVGCYQGGENNCKPNMTLENYKKIVDECTGKCNQFALGGHGDPDCHEDFEEILKYTREHGIVPNYTTSGIAFDEHKAQLSKQYCGAVAVSWYGFDFTTKAIEMLLRAGVTTNIHYVLSKKSIDYAVKLVRGEEKLPSVTMENGEVRKVNAVVFLLHKPVGKGKIVDMLTMDDPRVRWFFEAVDDNHMDAKIGFDSCTIPAIMNLTKHIDPDSTDTCEGGRFSMYITPDMYALPCSFDNQAMRFAFDLSGKKIKDAWDSEQFDMFRFSLHNSCPDCPNRANCMGGCPLVRDIVLCDKEYKELL